MYGVVCLNVCLRGIIISFCNIVNSHSMYVVLVANRMLSFPCTNYVFSQTDVIVNTASGQRDLKIGEISKALLQRAGYGIQQEIYNAPQTGHVIITKAYKLQCKQVYHTFCTEKCKDPAKQILAQKVQYELTVMGHLSKGIIYKMRSLVYPKL